MIQFMIHHAVQKRCPSRDHFRAPVGCQTSRAAHIVTMLHLHTA